MSGEISYKTHILETKGSEMHDYLPERFSAVAARNITHSNPRAPDTTTLHHPFC